MQFRDKTAYVWGLRYRWDPSLSRNPVPRFPHFMPPWPKPGSVSDHHVYISLFCHILSPPDDTLFVRDIISIVLRCPRDLLIHELWGCWFCPGHMLNGDLGGVGWDPFSPSQSTPQLSKGSHRFILEQVFAGTLSELYPPLCITGNQQLTWDWCLRTEHGA